MLGGAWPTSSCRDSRFGGRLHAPLCLVALQGGVSLAAYYNYLLRRIGLLDWLGMLASQGLAWLKLGMGEDRDDHK